MLYLNNLRFRKLKLDTSWTRQLYVDTLLHALQVPSDSGACSLRMCSGRLTRVLGSKQTWTKNLVLNYFVYASATYLNYYLNLKLLNFDYDIC